jgi:hypothetical protein
LYAWPIVLVDCAEEIAERWGVVRRNAPDRATPLVPVRLPSKGAPLPRGDLARGERQPQTLLRGAQPCDLFVSLGRAVAHDST